MPDPATIASLREAFLDLVEESILDIDYDADITSTGHQIDCSSFTMSGSLAALETFFEVIGITLGAYETWDDAIKRVLESPRQPDKSIR